MKGESAQRNAAKTALACDVPPVNKSKLPSAKTIAKIRSVLPQSELPSAHDAWLR